MNKFIKKYIRVEDGVYEIFDTHDDCSNHFGYKYDEYCTVLLDEEDIKNYRQSDTIKELCDEFVFVDGDCDPLLCTYEELIYWFNYSKEQQFKTRNCYGAIWIKGEHNEPILKSVAKMNEERKLELI